MKEYVLYCVDMAYPDCSRGGVGNVHTTNTDHNLKMENCKTHDE